IDDGPSVACGSAGRILRPLRNGRTRLELRGAIARGAGDNGIRQPDNGRLRRRVDIHVARPRAARPGAGTAGSVTGAMHPGGSAAANAWPSARTAWSTVAVLTFVYSIAFVHRIGLGLLVEPMQQDLQFSDTAIGWLAGALFAVPYTIGGPLCGWLAD